MHRIARGIATLVTAIALAACSGGASQAPVATQAADGGQTPGATTADSAPHRVGLDDGSCTMSGTIPGNGGKASLVFSVPGTYPFHCLVHPTMKGTITIS